MEMTCLKENMPEMIETSSIFENTLRAGDRNYPGNIAHHQEKTVKKLPAKIART